MKTISLVFVISCMFLLGMAGNVLAVNDPTGDTIGALDLASADAITSNKRNAAETPDDIKLCVKMASGSHLPGAIIWDFDVDNDTATGGGSIITGIPTATCGGTTCKDCSSENDGGFDFFVVMILRTQGDSSNFALCSNCQGVVGTCAERGVPSACDQGICYQLGNPCNIGDPGCYEIETDGDCTNCTPDLPAYPLANVCGFTGKECDKPLIKGEWYVGYGQAGENMVGNFHIRNTYNLNNGDEICTTLPWGLMVARMYTKILNDGTQTPFDPFYPTNNPPNFQASVFYDATFADEDDLFTLPGLFLDVNDWMPNNDCSVAGSFNSNDPCYHNSEGSGCGDVDVDAGDVADFLSEFGRSPFSRPCPNCVDNFNDQAE